MPLLEARNRLRRAGPGQVLGAFAGAALAGFALWAAAARPSAARPIASLLLAHLRWVFVFAMLHAAILVLRRRLALARHVAQSWFAALPIPRGEARLAAAARGLWPVLWQAGAVAASAGAFVRLAAGPGAAESLLLVFVGGEVAGAAVGFAVRPGRPAPLPLGSRYVPGRTGQRGAPSLDALGRWTVADAFASLNPRAAARAGLIILLAVPGGMSLPGALAAVTAAAAVVYGASVARAVLRVARAAADWLGSAPIRFGPFARALVGRALVHEAAAVTVLVAALGALGAPWSAALYFGAQALSLALVVAVVAVSAARRRRGARLGLGAAVLALALAEYLRHGAWMPVAGLVAAWHLRAGARA